MLILLIPRPLLEVYPQLADTPIEYAWGGTLAVTLNRMSHFGRLGKYGTYFTQGYSGHGVVIATLAGKLIADAIAGEPRSSIYSASSLPAHSLAETGYADRGWCSL